jgi:5'-3' exonuclease
MCGTDYNKNIYRVGPSKSYDLLLKYDNIEDIKSNTKHDTDILKFPRVREIFTKYEKDKLTKIPYCGRPKEELLASILKQYNININIPDIIKSFVYNNNIVIEE